MNITLFTRNNCPSCNLVKQAFAQNGTPYTELNVDTDLAARNALIQAGSRAVPTVMVNGRVIIGAFEIRKALGI